MTNFNSKDQPDFSHSLSRFNAGYWARVYGIMAALGPTDAALLETIYAHLPNVEPGKGRLAAMAGISEASVKRGRKRLREAGLIGYADGLCGGLKDETTLYTVEDIRVPATAAAIVARLTGVTMNPAQGFVHKDLSGGHSDPGTGVTMTPQGDHHEPRTGGTTPPKVHKGSAQPSTQSKTKAAASPPQAVGDAPARVPAPRVHLESGDANALKASPADKDGTQVADAIKVVEPALALPLPVQQIAGEGEAPVGLTAATQAQMSEFEQAVAKRKAELAVGAKPAVSADEPLHEADGEAEAGDQFEDLNEWAGEVAEDWDEVEADAVAA